MLYLHFSFHLYSFFYHGVFTLHLFKAFITFAISFFCALFLVYLLELDYLVGVFYLYR